MADTTYRQSTKQAKTSQQKSTRVLEDNRDDGQQIQRQKAQPIQRNNTGLPDNLKSGMENLSGYSMDDVKVHYNSAKPAQLNAHAYAQGTDIHLASGQEKHLPHEAWHVVQQKQGRVKPTKQMKGKVNVNDDAGLEKEADVMGNMALTMADHPTGNKNQSPANEVNQKQSSGETTFGFIDNRPQALAHNSLLEMAHHKQPAIQLIKSQPIAEALPIQRYIDPITGLENGLNPIGGPPPPFSIGKVPKLSKVEKRTRARKRRLKKQEEMHNAMIERQSINFNSNSPKLPDLGTPINIDPFSVEVRSREVTDHKSRNYGLLVRLPGKRSIDISHVRENIFDALMKNSTWYRADEIIWAKINGGGLKGYIKFDTSDVVRIEKALLIRHLILNQEAQPRSGKGRAAPDSMEGNAREPAKNEAAYESAKLELFHKPDTDTPSFKAEYSGTKIEATITHTGPWAKGIRDPGQSDVMGGQNAKNYIVDKTYKRPQGDRFNPFWGRNEKEKLGGRWEWLHLIGSSLGGPNTANNLVAGSYDANTKMIALEHRVANWGAIGYNKEFKPSIDKPIEIKTIATVNPHGSHVGDKITMIVKHKNKVVVTGNYEASNQTVITKAQYDSEEERVKTKIDEAREKGASKKL